MALDGEKDLNFKKGVCGAVYPLKDPAPQKDRCNLNSFDSTSILSQVARSAMNNFYGVISATITRFSPKTSLCS